jgi:hypothetical protein
MLCRGNLAFIKQWEGTGHVMLSKHSWASTLTSFNTVLHNWVIRWCFRTLDREFIVSPEWIISIWTFKSVTLTQIKRRQPWTHSQWFLINKTYIPLTWCTIFHRLAILNIRCSILFLRSLIIANIKELLK